ncbi:MAG: beta-phosphoglucomutase family hydrolase [Bacteroidales bacterium]|nr:beta-phosphoglucomutase family hydrolase [Bacteroidales bacterium]MCF8405812.1 beta-phosphoglucomutase family hydrolase [Bacteroidales bacterium]
MTKYKFDAVIFDLDGVITKTALVHSAAWKKMFDEYLLDREKFHGEMFVEFSHENDYLPFVDGKPRYKGVASFLESRGIKIPFGDPEDEAGKETICGLGNQKNEAFNDVLDRDGVEVYPSTVQLMEELIEKGIRVGVASSSKNCFAVLEKAGLLNMVETRVDGVVSAELGLKGKPEPDIFTTAADNLGVSYDRSVVVEDAVSGVQAGKKGNFGLVLGIARENNKHELKINGADLVVSDIAEIGFEGICKWFDNGIEEDNWSISYDNYFVEKEKTRETLFTVGNGYFGTRGALEEIAAGEYNYPGTYIAGLYNRLISKVGDRDVENEDFVNAPNWLPVQIKIENGEWLDLNKSEILSYHRKLDFRTGKLHKNIIVDLGDSKVCEFESDRFASMDNPHIAAMRYSLKPLNFSGEIELKSGIDGDIINDGVARYRQLNQQHLKPVKSTHAKEVLQLVVKTTQSNIEIATAADIGFYKAGLPVQLGQAYETNEASVFTSMKFNVNQGESIGLVKKVSMFTSQAWDSSIPESDSLHALKSLPGIDELFLRSEKAWDKIWEKIDIKIEGDRLAQKLIRMHLYHLMVSFSPHNVGFDASITARGLHGEAYRGHIFWDELFILPLYNLHFPEVSKSALMYRYRRLEEARKYSKENGYRGAMFPWQSGSDGREETQVVHLNPLTGKWGADFSSFQRHVSLAVAYNIFQYIQSSEDYQFLADFGAEIMMDICRFWISKAILNKESQRYSIKNVMGPDEFHEKYPDSEEGGLKDNTYTNIMVAWTIEKSLELLDKLSTEQKAAVTEKLDLSNDEMEQWKHVSGRLTIIIENDILSQYDGYFKLKELDWDYYKEKYGNIYRMDRLLKAEGKSADDYKVAKQADTLQTFYNLDEETVTGILQKLGYNLSDNYLAKNLEYYLARTSHGSTLSRVVHAQLANMINNPELSWELYSDALTSDFADVQGGTTGEGIHAGVMAGTVLIALQSFAGLDLKSGNVKFDPHLPLHWRSITFKFSYKKVEYTCTVSKEDIVISQNNDRGDTVNIDIKGTIYNLRPGDSSIIKLNN